ncbi:MAG: hypothetical protein A3B14_00195 [Candidatus Zambryskibacteria bacterium RIFCSPLOWO2_01_FULL_45_21]|uniref:OmpA-like domain-containing protein n=1 Tax=Candidatus Zambryskibacteria bacterium RIFCSPLOWO2_01_FULL_45_21 TaxID=1802761 RepID=A0A1G2U2E8_9BACT|nr:MAG: hypothetical protein A3B14_00195 [Candidatus Zambryskibacteria bacterium RIFCSPLOWO2_01_FULL_45_21]
MKPLPKLILIAMAAAVVFFGGRWVVNNTSLGEKIVPGAGNGSSQVASSRGDDVVNVCVVTWVGYAGGQYFNGGFQASKESRYFKEYGVLVNFRLIDDFDSSIAAWQSGECQVHWFTADAAPTLFDDLKAAGYNPQIFFQADWSRGGDAIVVIRNINNMRDLRGKRIAVAYGTPSHTFLLRALEAANMTVRDVSLVEVASALASAATFKAREVDAAVVWSPDDADAVASITGAKILTSTREARYIIPDVFFADAKWLDSHQSQAKALVEGWLRGAAELNHDNLAKDEVIDILVKGTGQPKNFFEATINNARWTTYGDNVTFFNLEGNASPTTMGERVYNETGQLYRQYTDLVRSEGFPSWREVTNTSVLRSISLSGPEDAAESAVVFSAPTKEMETAEALASKPIIITFSTGSAVLDDNAKTVVDVGFVPTAQSFAGNRIRIEGNTDGTGSREVNMQLSRRRAQAVADYLAQIWNFDRNRFIIVGNGPDKPVCNENNPGGSVTLSDCQSRNRRTEFQLLSSGK